MAQPTGNDIVSTLPKLVLDLILNELSARSCSRIPRNRHPHRDMLAVSQVCVAWRRMALDPKLWAQITFPDPSIDEDSASEPEWSAELIRRSEQSLLSFCIELRYTGGDGYCKLMERSMDRIKHICIHCDNLQRGHPLVGVLMRHPAERMESLTLHCRGNSGRRVIFEPRADELFMGHAPSLTRLNVSPGVGVLPHSAPKLVHYSVVRRDVERSNYDLHSQLSLMKCLETLRIESDVPDRLDWRDRHEIQLRGLRELVIVNDYKNFEHLLEKIAVPSSCMIRLVFEEDSIPDVPDSDEGIRRVFEKVGRRGVDGGRRLSVQKTEMRVIYEFGLSD